MPILLQDIPKMNKISMITNEINPIKPDNLKKIPVCVKASNGRIFKVTDELEFYYWKILYGYF